MISLISERWYLKSVNAPFMKCPTENKVSVTPYVEKLIEMEKLSLQLRTRKHTYDDMSNLRL